MLKNYKMVLEYDGSRYDGWQKQGNTDRTIQGKLEGILERLAEVPVEIHGSGRTDAGVHALAQTANFHLDTRMSEGEIKDYLNQYLPEDIRVISLDRAGDRFHSRLNAEEKTYLYRIETGERKQVFERKYIYGFGRPLDVNAMREASRYFLGEHDFKSFCSNKKMKKSTVRILKAIEFEEEGSRLFIRYTGNGFLNHMVRILMGTLIEVGEGKRSPKEMKEILKAMDRSAAGTTAPAEGLFLEKVSYKD
ncbi:tRNA pseudouridine(38-40) synthase TruA [Lacrimispora sp.]|uniref:tRNA pseudouridine(38-40) synthase TruA n=1 Tax=Lacrimispora sp. TaxID=2719234 RepID=UPI0028A9536C|nr:tRNA pseudouridine(38-40) synthase TruA [Lacrimispora sp.]